MEGADDECQVCCETFTSERRARISCACGLQACRECVREYLLDHPLEPKCMECHTAWDRAHLIKHCLPAFVTRKLRTKLSDALWEAEKARLPATLASGALEHFRTMRQASAMLKRLRHHPMFLHALEQQGQWVHLSQRVFEDTFALSRAEYTDGTITTCLDSSGDTASNRLTRKFLNIYKRVTGRRRIAGIPIRSSKRMFGHKQYSARTVARTRNLLVSRKDMLRDFAQAAQDLQRFIDTQYTHWRNVIDAFHDAQRAQCLLRDRARRGWRGGDQARAKKKATSSYHHACPYADCRGFLSTAYKCGVCERYTCSRCMIGVGNTRPKPTNALDRGESDHVCKEDDVASATYIKKHSRPCPSCGIRISKVSGCDQMWCVECNVAFSWRTGAKITSGVIHNPHYFEAKRKGLVAPVRAPGDVVCGGLPRVYDWVYHYDMGVGTDIYTQTYNLQQRVRVLRNMFARPTDHLELRLRYLLGEITETQARTSLLRAWKMRDKKRNMLYIYEVVLTVLTECLQMIVQNQMVTDEVLTRIWSMRKYANTELAKLSTAYGQQVDMFTVSYVLSPVSSKQLSSSENRKLFGSV